MLNRALTSFKKASLIQFSLICEIYVMQLKLTLPQSNFFYIDSENQVHAFFSINSGHIVGGDNTCQSAASLKECLLGDTGLNINSIQAEADNTISALEAQIKFIENNKLPKSALQMRVSQLRQFKAWKALLDQLVPSISEPFSNEHYPDYPRAIEKALRKKNNNLAGIRLSPESKDNFLKIPPVFSLERNTANPHNFESRKDDIQSLFSSNKDNIIPSSKFFIDNVIKNSACAQQYHHLTRINVAPTQPIPPDVIEVLYKDDVLTAYWSNNEGELKSKSFDVETDLDPEIKPLAQSLLTLPENKTTNNPKTILKVISKVIPIANDEELKSLIKVMNQALQDEGMSPCILKKKGSEEDKEKQQEKRQEAADYKYFVDDVMFIDAKASIDEWVSMLIEFEGCLFNSSVFQTHLTGDSHVTGGPQLFDIKLQLFLAIINVYYYALTGERKNFGEVLDNKRKVMDAFISKVTLAMHDNFNIEKHIFDFIDEHKSQFFGRPLTKDEKETIQKRFTDICNTLTDGKLPHYDEFLINILHKKGDFNVLKNKLSISVARFTKYHNRFLYLGHFRGKKLPTTVPFHDTNELDADKSNTNLTIDLSLEQFYAMQPSVLVETLLSVQKDEMYFESLTDAAVNNFKKRQDWEEIYDLVLNHSSMTRVTLDKFSTKFKLSQYLYPLTLTEVEAIFASAALKSAANPKPGTSDYNEELFSFATFIESGVDKLKLALSILDISFDDISLNGNGGYYIKFKNANSKEVMDTIKQIAAEMRYKHYITPQMAGVTYNLAKSMSPGYVQDQLNRRTNTDLDTRNSKIAYALSEVLNTRYFAFSFLPDSQLEPSELKVEYIDQSGYLVTAGDAQQIQRLRQEYNSHLTVELTADQIQILLEEAKLNADNVSISEIEKEFKKLDIYLTCAKKQGTKWSFIVPTESMKQKLAAFSSKALRESFENKKAHINYQIKQLKETFNLSTTDQEVDNGLISQTTFVFKTKEERQQFADSLELEVVTKNDHSNQYPLNVPTSAIEHLNLAGFCYYHLNVFHNRHVNAVLESNALFFQKSLLSKSTFSSTKSDIPGKKPKKSEGQEWVTQVIFEINPADPFESFVANYLQHYHPCQLNKNALTCEASIFAGDPFILVKNITMAYGNEAQKTLISQDLVKSSASPVSAPSLFTTEFSKPTSTTTTTTTSTITTTTTSTANTLWMSSSSVGSTKAKTAEVVNQASLHITPSLARLIYRHANQTIGQAAINQKQGSEKLKTALVQGLGIKEADIFNLVVHTDGSGQFTFNGYKLLATRNVVDSINNLVTISLQELPVMQQEATDFFNTYSKKSKGISSLLAGKQPARINALIEAVGKCTSLHELLGLLENQRDLAINKKPPSAVSPDICSETWTKKSDGLPQAPAFLTDLNVLISRLSGTQKTSLPTSTPSNS